MDHGSKNRDDPWFDGSKILADDGGPLVVHHFTYNDFPPEAFDRMWAANYFRRNPEGIDTVGLWFTDNPKARYVNPDWGGKRMDVELNIRRPFYIDDDKEGDGFNQLSDLVISAGGANALRDRMKAQGFDGIVLCGTFLDRVHQNAIIAFDADQVRACKPTDEPEPMENSGPRP